MLSGTENIKEQASQKRQRLLFHGFMCLWLRNLGLRPSNNLAITAHFISWNDAIVSYVCSCLFFIFYCISRKQLILRFNCIHAAAQLCVPDSFKQIGRAADAAKGRVGGDDFVIGGQHDVAIYEGFL